MIHLDTSFLIRALARDSGEDRQLRVWLADGMPVGISALGWAEFLCGPVGPTDVELATRIVQDPVPLMAADAVQTARLFNLAGRRRGSLVDCMVAAIALRAGAALATTNRVDFRRFEPAGLRVIVG